MAIVALASQQSFTAGTRTFEAAVPLSVSSVSVLLDRRNWPTDTQKNILSARIFWSRDNGVTWKFLCGITAAGGPPNNVNTAFGAGIPEPANALRRVRVELANRLDMTTTISVDLV